MCQQPSPLRRLWSVTALPEDDIAADRESIGLQRARRRGGARAAVHAHAAEVMSRRLRDADRPGFAKLPGLRLRLPRRASARLSLTRLSLPRVAGPANRQAGSQRYAPEVVAQDR